MDGAVLRARDGDRVAFAELVEAAQEGLFGFLFRKLRNRHLAEDLLADTFLKAAHPAQLQGRALPGPHLAVHDRPPPGHRPPAQATRRGPVASLDGEEETDALVDPKADSPAGRANRDHAAAVVRKALERLPARYAEALDLLYLQGMDRNEVAVVLGCSANAASSLLTRRTTGSKRKWPARTCENVGRGPRISRRDGPTPRTEQPLTIGPTHVRTDRSRPGFRCPGEPAHRNPAGMAKVYLPAVPRLWKVALGQCAYVPAERRHLAACLHCQHRAGEVERQAGVAGGKPAEAPRIFRRPAVGSRQEGRPLPHLSRRSRFGRQADARQGRRKLAPGGTPPLAGRDAAARGAGPAACVQSWFAPALATGGRATARLCLGAAPFAEATFLSLEPLASSDLKTEHLTPLRDALIASAGDAPTMAAWQEWGKVVLKAGQLPPAVRAGSCANCTASAPRRHPKLPVSALSAQTLVGWHRH